jgi:hypothetical protein
MLPIEKSNDRSESVNAKIKRLEETVAQQEARILELERQVFILMHPNVPRAKVIEMMTGGNHA